MRALRASLDNQQLTA